jgi:hypothetical protein
MGSLVLHFETQCMRSKYLLNTEIVTSTSSFVFTSGISIMRPMWKQKRILCGSRKESDSQNSAREAIENSPRIFKSVLQNGGLRFELLMWINWIYNIIENSKHNINKINFIEEKQFLKIKTIFVFRCQSSLFICSHSRSIDADLDGKATIPTTWFLSEITEINTDFPEILYRKNKRYKKIKKKPKFKCHVSLRLTKPVFVYTNCYVTHAHDRWEGSTKHTNPCV